MAPIYGPILAFIAPLPSSPYFLFLVACNNVRFVPLATGHLLTLSYRKHTPTRHPQLPLRQPCYTPYTLPLTIIPSPTPPNLPARPTLSAWACAAGCTGCVLFSP